MRVSCREQRAKKTTLSISDRGARQYVVAEHAKKQEKTRVLKEKSKKIEEAEVARTRR